MSRVGTRFGLAALVVGLAALAMSCESECVDLYREVSPDGRFEIVVCRRQLPFVMPGQGSDAPGMVRLRDVETGRTLHSTRLEMVQLMDTVEWSPDQVSIKLIASWPLPPAPQTPLR